MSVKYLPRQNWNIFKVNEKGPVVLENAPPDEPVTITIQKELPPILRIDSAKEAYVGSPMLGNQKVESGAYLTMRDNGLDDRLDFAESYNLLSGGRKTNHFNSDVNHDAGRMSNYNREYKRIVNLGIEQLRKGLEPKPKH